MKRTRIARGDTKNADHVKSEYATFGILHDTIPRIV